MKRTSGDIDRPARVPLDRSVPLIRRLWREWLRPHWVQLVLILAAIGFVAGATALYPLIINWAFDAFAAKTAWAITTLPWLVLFATTAKGLALFTQIALTTRVVTRVEADMQTSLYRHLVGADIARLARESPAALTQRFTTDISMIRTAINRTVVSLLRDLLTLVGLFAAMVYLDWFLALIALVILPVAIVPVTRVGKRLRRVSKNRQEQTGLMASLATETFGAARIVKTYGLETYLGDRARDAFERIRRLNVKAALTRGRMEPILEGLGGLAVAAILLVIGWRILEGDRTIGEFSGFLGALMIASQPMRSLSNINAVVQEGLAALQRFFAVIDEKPAVTERAGARDIAVTRGEVVFEAVDFAYGAGAPALHGVSFLAGAGETTAFVGRSGAGKSTIFNLIPRLYDVSGGAIGIDGTDIRDFTLASLRRAIAVVNQDVMLFNDTVRANIALGRRDATDAEIVEAARLAAADEFIRNLPEGYETIVGDRGTRLSGGERQRISLARAFLKDAPILLLDEATSALDSESEKLVQGALARLSRGRTTLVIAHRLSTIQSADRIVVLDDGRVVDTGTHGALLAADGLYAHFHRLQFADEPGTNGIGGSFAVEQPLREEVAPSG